jgi:uncharacterized protein (TIGR02246 family)
VSQLEKPILGLLDDYRAAVYAKDVDAFIVLYHQDVRVFDMWGKWSYEGVEAWRGMVADWFGTLGTERVIVAFDDVQTIVSQDVAVAHAFVTYKSVSAEGNELRAMRNRLTWALKHLHGSWRVIHEHTSAPVDFETSKVLLQR